MFAALDPGQEIACGTFLALPLVRAQGIVAESPQEAHKRFRGLAAESPVFCGTAAKNAPKLRTSNRFLNSRLGLFFVFFFDFFGFVVNFYIEAVEFPNR
jgi:hypothetical protein